MAKGNGVTRWSLSALQMYESCPARYHATRIAEVGSDAPSPAMERGVMIHAKAERYLLGDIPRVPKELAAFKQEFQNLRKRGAVAEDKRAYTRKWKPTGFDDDNAWLRLVVDAALGDDFMVDFKTGRIYEDKHTDQAQLYSTPPLKNKVTESMTVEFWYLDQDQVRTHQFNAIEGKHLAEYWEDRVAPLFRDTKWEPTPSKWGCRYCVLRDVCDVSVA